MSEEQQQIQQTQMQQQLQPQIQQLQQPQMQQLQQQQVTQQAQVPMTMGTQQQQQQQLQPQIQQHQQPQQMQQHQQPQMQSHQQPQMQQLQQQVTQQAQVPLSMGTQQQQQQLQPQMQQLQQPQLQQLQQQQAQVPMSMGSSVEQPNMNVTTSVPINVATINVTSQQHQMQQAIQQSSTSTTGTAVQMAVPQFTQSLNHGTIMSQSSAPHPTMMHPTMTMTQAPLQQVQVIQQPLSASYLQHLYSPQQQMLFPGNLTLQHTGMTGQLQNIGAAQGLSLQLQTKTMDGKTSAGQSIQANKGIALNTGTMMTASGQMISASPKTNFSQQMMSNSGKSTILHSQSGFSPNNANQTVVISQLGVLPNQQSIFSQKTITDSQKGKTYTFQNQPQALQPKSLYSSTVPNSAQVFNGGHLKQISSQPQIITSQAPGTMFTQAQLLGLQTLGSLPPGLSFATSPGCLQSTALLGQNPIIIRSQQSDMFIQQSQPQMHLPVAAQPMQQTASAIALPPKPKQVRPGTQTQTVAVATQTNVSSAVTLNSNTVPLRTQIKPKIRTMSGFGTSPMLQPQMATTQTQTGQQTHNVQPQSHQQKSDAGNQTYQSQSPVVPKLPIAATTTHQASMKSVSVEAKSHAFIMPSVKVSPSISSSEMVTVHTVSPTTVSSTIVCSVPAVTAITTTVTSSASVVPSPKMSSALSQTPVDSKVAELPVQTVLPCEPTQKPPEEQKEASTTPLPKPEPPQQIPKPTTLGPKQAPQKAIVKPQVLTHVIDGWVIQEGSEPFPVEPFPVGRSALWDLQCRNASSEKSESPQKRKDSSHVDSPEKKLKAHRPRGGPGRKKKMFRGRKGSRKQSTTEEDMEEEESSSTPEVDPATAQDDESSLKTDEPSTEDSTMQVEMKGEEGHAHKLPTKWTVQDVFEFVRDLPGCSDYADTFRSQEIDGQALLLLKEDHLMTAMCMKLGPALKLISHVRTMKEESGETT